MVNEQMPMIGRADGAGLGLNDSIYNRLLRERIIWLGSEVRDENANAICAQMMLLAAEDPDKDILLYINSPGGSITAGMAIYDTMQYIQPDVATVAMGMAASMGQFLLSSGAKGKRYATAARPRDDAPAVRRHRRHGDRRPDQRAADHAHEDGARRAHRRADRQDRRADHTPTPTATAGSPPPRRWSTGSSTTSSTHAGSVAGGGGTADRLTRAPDPLIQTRSTREHRVQFICTAGRLAGPAAGGRAAVRRAEPPVRAAAVRGAHGLRLQAPGPVHQALRGPHHLPRRAGRRRLRRRRHGPAARAREHGPGPRHHPVHQLARWLVHGHDRDLRHDAVHQAADPDRVPRAGRLGGCRAARGAGTPGKRLALPNARVLIHQPAMEGGGYAQASDIEIHANELIRMREWLEATLAHHSGRDVEQVRKRHRARQDPHRRPGAGVRPGRPGAREPQGRRPR